MHTLLLALLLGLQGCGGLPWREEAAESLPAPGHETTTALLVRAALLAQLRGWKGVPYRLGGSDRRGLDCSAFAQITFRERFGIDIPRETAAQRAAGREVALPEVTPGDLLFFDTGPRVQHVGIYAGRRQFLHVSTQAGVMLSSVLDPYWSQRLRAAIRVTVP
jgi:cell wall-associated NlpC family hydrolase